jgi:hypothetical protein
MAWNILPTPLLIYKCIMLLHISLFSYRNMNKRVFLKKKTHKKNITNLHEPKQCMKIQMHFLNKYKLVWTLNSTCITRWASSWQLCKKNINIIIGISTSYKSKNKIVLEIWQDKLPHMLFKLL